MFATLSNPQYDLTYTNTAHSLAVQSGNRVRTAHIRCTINGTTPYSDDAVIACVGLVRMWDYPSSYCEELQNRRMRALEFHGPNF